MVNMAPVEPLVRRTFRYEVRASPVVAGGGDLGGGPRHIQLVESRVPRTHYIHKGVDPGGVHMADFCPPPQREWRLSGHQLGRGHMEDGVRNYKPTNWYSGPVP